MVDSLHVFNCVTDVLNK
uniref:Uncharacterized protein n=1 Tax=Rhizophora mucronata TaxID=61149 RepID=A0A2P2NF09_RHIMU